MEGFEETIAALRAAVALVEPGRRQAAAKDFARRWGAEDLIVFVHDVAVGKSLPAPGFRQTLRGARAWHQLVATAIDEGTAQGSLENEQGAARAAFAVGLPDGTAAVLVGDAITEPARPLLREILPLFGALFRTEAAAARAEVESKMARTAAKQVRMVRRWVASMPRGSSKS